MFINTGSPIENQWTEVEWSNNGLLYRNSNGVWSFNIFVNSTFENTVIIKGNKGCFNSLNYNINLSTDDGDHVVSDVFGSTELITWRNDYDILICNNIINPAVAEIQNITIIQKNTGIQKISLKNFDLTNIDQMREECLKTQIGETMYVNDLDLQPFNDCIRTSPNYYPAAQYSQQGLAVKTYQSDIFNNWLNNEYIDGDNGINQITALSTNQDYITINEIQLNKKIYDMLNRIAMSGGTYSDWLEVNWGGSPYYITEIPVYEGDCQRKLYFRRLLAR